MLISGSSDRRKGSHHDFVGMGTTSLPRLNFVRALVYTFACLGICLIRILKNLCSVRL